MATNRWRAYLTPDKRKYLRQLCNKHGDVIDAFNRLLPMETLFQCKNAFHIGVFHKLGNLHCDQVCIRELEHRLSLTINQYLVNYLENTVSFWSRVSNNGAYHITADFVEAMQGRCPKFSQRDHECLQKTLEADGLLGYLPHEAREHIYHTIVLYNLTIPSLYTFFQDWKYIGIICEVLKSLLSDDQKPRKDSLERSFQLLFSPSWSPVIQTSHNTFVSCQLPASLYRFDLAFWQLCLATMRLWAFVLIRRGRKAQRGSLEQFENVPRTSYWSLLARTARRLGFDSEQLRSLEARQPDADISMSPQYPGFTDSRRCRRRERHGIPFDDKYLLDRNSLFLSELKIDQEVINTAEGEDITTLLVRRSFFCRIFPHRQLQAVTLNRHDALPLNMTSYSGSQGGQSVFSTISMTPQNAVPEQRRTPPRHGTHLSPVPVSGGGEYGLDVLHGQQLDSRRHMLTRAEWEREVIDHVRRHFTLWEPNQLVSVDSNQLHNYRGRHLIAVGPNDDIGRLRAVRHLATRD